MDRRNFLKGASAVPIVAALPIVVEAGKPETMVTVEQGWPKLEIGDVVARSTMHDGFLLVQDDQTIDGMIVSSDDYTYSVALIENPESRRLFRHRR